MPKPKEIDTIADMKAREWQSKAYDVVNRCNASDGSEVIPVNACVGSGKTNVAAYALGDFIKKNLDGKTVQMFVTPRIKLCAQQANEIQGFIEEEFGLKAKADFDIIRKDCTQRDIDLKSDVFTSKHAIFIVCDESLWGIEKDGTEKRIKMWMKFLRAREAEGYKLGNFALDEAHNYTASHDKIFGKGA